MNYGQKTVFLTHMDRKQFFTVKYCFLSKSQLKYCFLFKPQFKNCFLSKDLKQNCFLSNLFCLRTLFLFASQFWRNGQHKSGLRVPQNPKNSNAVNLCNNLHKQQLLCGIILTQCNTTLSSTTANRHMQYKTNTLCSIK